MGIRQDINSAIRGLCKKANSVWGYYPPAHNQQAESNLAKKIPNMAWGTLGVGSGLAKGVWDRTFGDGAQGGWKDYLKEGWNAGFNHGDLAAAGMLEGMANSIPFVEQKTIPSFVDFVRNEKVDSGMEPEVADSMRTRGNYAGMLAMLSPTWKAFGLAGKGIGALSNITGNTAGKVLPHVGKVISKGGPVAFWGKMFGYDDAVADAYKAVTYTDEDADLDYMRERIASLSQMDPSAKEYAEEYDYLKRMRNKDPQAFDGLRKPVKQEPRPGPWLTNASASI